MNEAETRAEHIDPAFWLGLVARSAARRHVAENDMFAKHVAEIEKQRHVFLTCR